MKIVVLAGYSPSLLNFRADLMQEMGRRGCEVVACGPEYDDAVSERLASMGIRFRQVPLERTGKNPLKDMASITKLERVLREERPQKLLAYTIKPVIYGTMAAARAGVPERYALITGLGSTFEAGGIVSSVVKGLYRRSLSKAHCVIVQNPDDRDDLVEMGVVPFAKFEVVNGSGVDCDHFAQAELPQSQPHFLMVSRVLAEKGARVFAEAARIVKYQFPGARFTLLGPIDSSPSAIGQEEIESWVEQGFLEWQSGWTADVRPAVASCTVFVLPSYYREGTPRTVLEAMSMGRAIITTNSPGCRETIRHGEEGLLVEPRNTESLAVAMLRMASDREFVEDCGRKARLRAVEKYDVHKVNADYLRILGIA